MIKSLQVGLQGAKRAALLKKALRNFRKMDDKLFCLRGLCAFSCRETFSHSFVLNSGFSIDSWQKDGLFSQPNFLIFSGPANAGHEDVREAGLLSREHQEHRPIPVRVKYWTFSISVTIMM